MLDKPTIKNMIDTPVAQRMPREIAPGVFWIGDAWYSGTRAGISRL